MIWGREDGEMLVPVITMDRMFRLREIGRLPGAGG